jgi:hypothetical protein
MGMNRDNLPAHCETPVPAPGAPLLPAVPDGVPPVVPKPSSKTGSTPAPRRRKRPFAL